MFRFFPAICLLLNLALAFIGETQAQMPDLQPDSKVLKIAGEMEARAFRSGDSLLLGKAYFHFGEAFNRSGTYAVCTDYYLRAISLLKPYGASQELGMSYLHLNWNLNLSADSNEAMDNAKTALKIFEQLKSAKGIADAYNHMTTAFKAQWVWNESRVAAFKNNRILGDSLTLLMDKIEEFGRIARDTNMIAEAELQRGDLYRKLQNRKAIHHLENALSLFQMARHDTAAARTMCHIAAFYNSIRKYRNAKKYLDMAHRKMQEGKIDDFWVTALYQETEIALYVETKQWKKAYETTDLYRNIQHYRRKGDRDYLVQSVNLLHEAERKDELLGTQRKELKSLQTIRNLSLVILILLLVSAVTSVVYFRLYRKNKKISRQNEELVREQNHRVKNNLQVVSSLLALQADQLIDPAASHAVHESQLRVQSMAILHQKLYDGEYLAKVNLRELIPEVVSAVIHTFGIFVKPQYHIDSIYLSADKATPIGLILNELVTNACKYAFPDNPDPRLLITCGQTGRKIRLQVVDNGPGLEQVGQSETSLDSLFLEQTGTFGLLLINSQVAQLNGDARFETVSTEGGTRFEIIFNA